MKKQESKQERLEMVQFTVERIGDIRTLLVRWRTVLAELEETQMGIKGVVPTFRQVGVEVEHRRPGMEVLLTFLAPPEVLRRFKADLRDQGLTVQEELLLPGVLSSCRLLSGPKH
jgi:hypothetical protein